MKERPPIESAEQESLGPRREIVLFDALVQRLALDPRYSQQTRRASVVFEVPNKRGKTTKETRTFQRREWRAPDFDAIQYLSRVDAPFVEIAGPTPQGYMLVDIERLKKLGKKFITSNLFPGLPTWKSKNPPTLKSRVDFQSDATALAVRDESLGAFFCSCFGYIPAKLEPLPPRQTWEEHHTEARQRVIQEAWRTLQKGGLLVWQSGRSSDVIYMAQIGLEPMIIAADSAYKNTGEPLYGLSEPSYHVIFKKPRAKD